MTPEPEQLFEQNQRLAYSVIWKIAPNFANDEDLKQEALLGLWKACLTWDPKKSQFSTYSVRCIRNQIYMYFRKQSKLSREISLDTPISGTEQITLADMLEDPIPSIRDEKLAVRDLLDGLSPREIELVQAKLDGKPQYEIGKLLGVSQSMCSRMLTKIRVRYERSIQEDG